MSQKSTVPDPELVDDVREGLTSQPKSIPPKWLYDERGSELFEAITELDEYYLTRTERAILEANAGAIIDACPGPAWIVELGAGSADKTRTLIEAALDRRGEVTYCPIDISPKAIEMATQRLGKAYEGLTIRPLIGEYTDAFEKVRGMRTPPKLVAFIGSSIGNFDLDDQVDLLASWADVLEADDRFLLGTDMRKPAEILEPAYDDSQGVTARFTKNLLHRLNRELGADFDVDAFAHRARFNPDASRVEIHLESLEDQDIHLSALDMDVHFDEGERLHTENSYKYTETMIDDLVEAAGFERTQSWYDDQRWFGVHLLAPDGHEQMDPRA